MSGTWNQVATGARLPVDMGYGGVHREGKGGDAPINMWADLGEAAGVFLVVKVEQTTVFRFTFSCAAAVSISLVT